MKRRFSYKKSVLIFSRWSRKKYATFISLGRVVNIARVSVSVCNQALKKSSALKGLINNIFTTKKDPVKELIKLLKSLGIPDLPAVVNTFFLQNITILSSTQKTIDAGYLLHLINENPCFISDKAWIFCLVPHSHKKKQPR